MFGVLVCIAAGAAMSVQGVMNTRLGEHVGASEANAFVQATAAALAAAALLFHRDGSFAALGGTSWLYMLGGALLVAPVMNESGEAEYYLPAGMWTHLLSGEKRQGPGWFRETCGYETLPLYVREGCSVTGD